MRFVPNLSRKGIRVSVLYPPDTDTPQLAWENQYKPKETRAISGAPKPISPDWVAQYTLRKLRGKYAIVPGFDAKSCTLLARLGNLIYPIMDLLVRSASKRRIDLHHISDGYHTNARRLAKEAEFC